jgi:hypothetical protein
VQLKSQPVILQVGLLALGSIALLLTGCGSANLSQDNVTVPSPDASVNPWAAEFAQMRERPVSEFIKQILADDEITEAEFREALDREVQCLRDFGLNPDVFVNPDTGVSQMGLPEDENAAAMESNCWWEWNGGIVDIYPSIVTNPENKDFFDVRAECLVHEGLAPEGFTGRDLEDAWTAAYGEEHWTANAGEDPVLVDAVPITDPDPVLSNGLHVVTDPAVGPCITNPEGVMAASRSN